MWTHLVENFVDQSSKLVGGGTLFGLFCRLGIAVVQTKPKAPEPIRTPKLSDFRHS